MDAKTKIITILSETTIDCMTAGQIAEAGGISISAVNAQIPTLLERQMIAYSGDVVTAGRYAKQYSITERGQAVASSEHKELILMNEKAAFVPEQILNYVEDQVHEVMIRLEKFLSEIEARAAELHVIFKNQNAESVALARINTAPAAPQPVAEKPVSVDKKAVYGLKQYVDGADITPVVTLLKDEKTKIKWVDLRLEEYGVSTQQQLPDPVYAKLAEIVMAAKATHGWGN